MRGDRLLVGLLGVIAAACLIGWFYQYGMRAAWLPACLFHRLTGLNCPGCGMTRATHAALHGHLGTALRCNPLGMVLLPAAMVGLGLELTGWLAAKPPPVSFRIGGRWALGLCWLVLAFWILRNIPAWPFSLLAPP